MSDARDPAVLAAPSWQKWIAENLLRGVAANVLVDRLVADGWPTSAARAAVEAVNGSPLFEAARPFAREARRARMGERLRLANARCASTPGTVPRLAGVDAAMLRDVFVASGTPVVLTDVVTRWPAFGSWTPRSFAERFGDEEVSVSIGRDADPDYDVHAETLHRTMRLADLVRLIESGPSNDAYLVARGRALERSRLRELLDEVRMPDGYLAMERALGAAQLWLGPAGTVTPLHHDTSNILFCQVHGRKRWRLVSPWESTLLDDARSIYGGRDPERDDMGDVLVKEVVLEPGEALFVPVGWWHHVRALDASISLAFVNFAFPNRLDWYRPGQVR